MLIIIYVILTGCLSTSLADDQTKRLFNHLATNYSKLVRPVFNNSNPVNVAIGLQLSRVIDMDEKNQILTTSVWFTQIWKDHRLAWDPDNFGNITIFYLPAVDIWVCYYAIIRNSVVLHVFIFVTKIPEIVLYNTANGQYEPSMITKASIHSDGLIIWRSPAIFKSSCILDVEYFPFDEQVCYIKFSSWVYDGFQVNLKHVDAPQDEKVIPNGIDMSTFVKNFEWDVMDVESTVDNKYNDSFEEFRPYIKFSITLRRKPLFYTVNLIIPCVSMSFLTVTVFGLPSESGEKVTLCISVLLALTLFFLLLVDIMPPTSLVIPLFGRYLLFTITMVTLSIVATIYVLNIHHRSPKSHPPMPNIVRKIFLGFLARFLFKNAMSNEWIKQNIECCSKQSVSPDESGILLSQLGMLNLTMPPSTRTKTLAFRNIRKIFKIANIIKQESDKKRVMEEWKYLAMVLDRLLFFIFISAFVIGTLHIFFKHPRLFDNRKPLE